MKIQILFLTMLASAFASPSAFARPSCADQAASGGGASADGNDCDYWEGGTGHCVYHQSVNSTPGYYTCDEGPADMSSLAPHTAGLLDDRYTSVGGSPADDELGPAIDEATAELKELSREDEGFTVGELGEILGYHDLLDDLICWFWKDRDIVCAFPAPEGWDDSETDPRRSEVEEASTDESPSRARDEEVSLLDRESATEDARGAERSEEARR